MKLKDALSVISGGTKICIYVGCVNIFSGKMSDITKEKWDKDIGIYMDCDVIRLNTVNDTITIAI